MASRANKHQAQYFGHKLSHCFFLYKSDQTARKRHWLSEISGSVLMAPRHQNDRVDKVSRNPFSVDEFVNLDRRAAMSLIPGRQPPEHAGCPLLLFVVVRFR